MGRYVWRSCSNCGYRIESGVVHYVAIGNPLFTCPKCNASIRLNHINEWELMSLVGKIVHLLSSLKTALFLSVLTGFLISLIMKLVNQEIDILTLFFISIIIAFTFTIIMVVRNILDSKKRMSEPEYRKMLSIK